MCFEFPKKLCRFTFCFSLHKKELLYKSARENMDIFMILTFLKIFFEDVRFDKGD